jgi:Flp pilus assembly protein TadG
VTGRATSDERGQSLVELAIALPVLLLLLIGIADAGRLYFYGSTLATAAREGAWYAARIPGATQAAVAQRVCDETGWAAVGSPCPASLVVTYAPDPSADLAHVDVMYPVDLMSGYLARAVVRMQPVPLRASATFPYLGYGKPQP